MILASISTRMQPVEATVANLSEGGARLRTSAQEFIRGVSLSAGDDVCLGFEPPATEHMLEIDGRVLWATADACGVRFRYIPETQRGALEQWLTECVERTLARVCERIGEACA